MEARIEGVASVLQREPAGRRPGVAIVLGRHGLDARLAGVREFLHAATRALGEVERRLGGVDAHAVEIGPLEGDNANALVVVDNLTLVGLAARNRAFLDDDLHVPGLATVRQLLAGEATHARRRLLLGDLLACALQTDRFRRTRLFERQAPLGTILRIVVPLHVVEDDVARVLEPAVRQARTRHAEVAAGRAARLLDVERHVGEAPVAHVVLGAELQHGRTLCAETAVGERDVLQERNVLRAADADVERRMEAVDRHVRETHVLDAERHDFALRGRDHVTAARRIDMFLRRERIAHRRQVELDAKTGIGADDVVEGDVANRTVARPANADGALVGAQHAVREGHALARTHLAHLLLVRADDQRVVLRVDDAVRNRHVAAAAEVETVAIRELAVALDTHAAALYAVAVEEPGAPTARLVDEHVIEADVLAAHEEDAAPRDVRVADTLPAAVYAMVEGGGIAVDRTRPRNRDIRLAHGVEHRTLVEAWRTLGTPHGRRLEFGVLVGIFAPLQRGATIDVKIDTVLEVERVGLVDAAPRYKYASTALRGTIVDCLLNRRRVVGDAIRLRAERRHVDCRCGRGKRERGNSPCQ